MAALSDIALTLREQFAMRRASLSERTSPGIVFMQSPSSLALVNKPAYTTIAAAPHAVPQYNPYVSPVHTSPYAQSNGAAKQTASTVKGNWFFLAIVAIIAYLIFRR